jgi:phage baseplate assembly protein W
MTDEIRGFSVPFRIDPLTGGVSQQSGDEKLRQNIIHLLMTRIGERTMLRTYGGGVHDMLHDPNNDTLRALAQHQIAKAIAHWEPRVQLQKVDISQDKGQLFIEIHYRVRRTNQAESLAMRLPIGAVY